MPPAAWLQGSDLGSYTREKRLIIYVDRFYLFPSLMNTRKLLLEVQKVWDVTEFNK